MFQAHLGHSKNSSGDAYKMKTYNTAVIGCGAIHTLHVQAINSVQNAHLYAVVDIDKDRADQHAEKYGCKSFVDYKEMLADENIDCVHICTPHFLHVPMAIDCLKAGKHVLMEKPLAISTHQAQQLEKICKNSDSMLGICFQNRYNDASVKTKEIISQGFAGKVLGARAFVTWHRNASYYASGQWRGKINTEGGGVLINQAIHTLDLVQWFTGKAVSVKGSVYTSLLEKYIEVEDTASASIIFDNGATAVFYATNCHVSDSPVLIEIECENAVLRIENDLTIRLKNTARSSDDLINLFGSSSETCTENTVAANNQIKHGEKACWGTGHERLISDFYKKISTGEKFPVDFYEALETVKIIEGIYVSSKTGKFVELN